MIITILLPGLRPISQTTFVVWVCFIHTVGETYNVMLITNESFWRIFLMVILFILRVFEINLLIGILLEIFDLGFEQLPKKYFFLYFVLMSDMRSEPWPHV